MNIRLAAAPAGAAYSACPAETTDAFSFRGPDGIVRAGGGAAPIPSGTAATLRKRIAAAFAGAGPDAVLGGALPFDNGCADAMWLGRTPRHAPRKPASGTTVPRCTAMTAEPSRRDYAAAVTRALAAMRDGPLCKIVLARTLRLRFDAALDPDALLAALADDAAATAFRVTLPGGALLIGATPELLVAKTGARVRSFPLAGSARRIRDPARDAAACAGLAVSDKDRREHAMVIEAIMDTLAPYCRTLAAPEGTCLTATRSMWHLGTRIEGELADPSIPVPLLAAALHPTPAVCGVPRDPAAALIPQLEPQPRGFYAGAVGWCDAAGDGAWHVAIRCAEIAGAEARLFAGAGIVPGSDPAAETAETGAKFGAMLAALGLPRDAALTLQD